MDNFISMNWQKGGRSEMLTEEILKDALHYGKAFTKLGKTAQYIPQLKEVNKYYLGVCAMDLDGMVLEAGDTRVPFTIQSISKLVSLILAIRDCGADHLFHEKVGVEPTGDPFNCSVSFRYCPGLRSPSRTPIIRTRFNVIT